MPYNPNIQTAGRIDPGMNAANNTLQALAQFGSNITNTLDRRNQRELQREQLQMQQIAQQQQLANQRIEAEGRAALNKSNARINNSVADLRQMEIDRENIRIDGIKAAGVPLAKEIISFGEEIKSLNAADMGATGWLHTRRFLARFSPNTWDPNASLEANQAAFLKSEVYLYNPEVQKAYDSIQSTLPKFAIRIGSGENERVIPMNEVKRRIAEGEEDLLTGVWSNATPGSREDLGRLFGVRMAENGYMDLRSSAEIDRIEKKADRDGVPRELALQQAQEKEAFITNRANKFIEEAKAAGDVMTNEGARLMAEAEYEQEYGLSDRKAAYIAAHLSQGFNQDDATLRWDAHLQSGENERDQATLDAEIIMRESREEEYMQQQENLFPDMGAAKREAILTAYRSRNTLDSIFKKTGASSKVQQIAILQEKIRQVDARIRQDEINKETSEAQRIQNHISEVNVVLDQEAQMIPEGFDDIKQTQSGPFRNNAFVDMYRRDNVYNDTILWQMDTALSNLPKVKEKARTLGDKDKIAAVNRQMDLVRYVRAKIKTGMSKADQSFFPDAGNFLSHWVQPSRWADTHAKQLDAEQLKHGNALAKSYLELAVKGKSMSQDRLRDELVKLSEMINPYQEEAREEIRAQNIVERKNLQDALDYVRPGYVQSFGLQSSAQNVVEDNNELFVTGKVLQEPTPNK